MTDPAIFNEALLTPHRVHHDVGTKALDLETPLWVAVPEPVERSSGQVAILAGNYWDQNVLRKFLRRVSYGVSSQRSSC
jgi:hypothetical protein